MTKEELLLALEPFADETEVLTPGGLMFYVPEHAKDGIEKAVAALDRKHEGLTKREYFAAMAMQGMFADSERGGHVALYAKDAVAAADALIAELAKATP